MTKSRLALILVATLVALAAAWWIYDELTSSDRFLLGLHALDDDRALVLFRMDYDKSEPHWRFGLYDRREEARCHSKSGGLP